MNRLFSLSACNMDLGLAHLRLASQMLCSHFAGSVKFSAKDITLCASFFYMISTAAGSNFDKTDSIRIFQPLV